MTPGNDLHQNLSREELQDAWLALDAEERMEGFLLLERDEIDDFFLTLSPHAQAQLIIALPESQRRLWMRVLAPDAALVGDLNGDRKVNIFDLLELLKLL